jgi:DNA-binding transcriptional regulator YiaG
MKAKTKQSGRARENARDDRSSRNGKALLMCLRTSFGLDRQILKRALHTSETNLAKWENGTSQPAPGNLAKMLRLKKMLEGLARAMKKNFIATWLRSPNEACEGKAPLDLLAGGDYEAVADLVYFLEAGEPV